MSKERIYLDNAATSWPKPPGVVEAVHQYLTESGAAAGRSGYREANDVERLILDARKQLGYLFGLNTPEQIVFGLNGTDALNLALHGYLRPGDHVVTTQLEHNSVLRPLAYLKAMRDIEVTYVAPEDDGRVSPEKIVSEMRDSTRLVAVTHASNVTGAVQPVEEIFALVRQRGARMLVDAAQTAGHVELNLSNTPIDMVAFAGHKGLLGPLGTGVLIVQADVVPQLEPIRQGGSGTKSELDQQPDDLPTKYESGNANVPGILGLRAGIEYLREMTITALHRQTHQNTVRLVEGLSGLPNVRLFGPADLEHQMGVVSIAVDSFDPHELATALDSAFGIQCRAGLHCAPLTHQHLGTIGCGGTLRFSLGVFNTSEQVDRTLEALHTLLRS